MSAFVVVLDVSVLFPATLRDTLLRAASAGLYRIRWTDDILEDVKRKLVNDRGIPEEKAQQLIDVMRKQFPEASITEHRSLISAMPNDPKDRHVLAAAVASRAQVIVTQHLRHFPHEVLIPLMIEAQSPDEFLTHLFHLAPERIAEIIEEQGVDLCNPSMTVLDVLDTLAQPAPNFADLVRHYLVGE